MPPHIRRAPWQPVLALLLITVLGGWLNTESARATVVSDATGDVVAPPTLRDVFFGNRHYRVGSDGVYEAPNLPRGAKITLVANGYARTDVNASDTEVRLVTALITTQVNDETGAPVPNPKARVGDSQPGNGTASGSMVIAPTPPKGTDILICAKDFASTTIKAGAANVTVTLKKEPGSDCPPLPSPSAAPTPVGQTPGPTPSVSPTTKPTPSPSPSP